MKAFMDSNFLLKTQTAQTLYHECAKNQPIWDYHCHLSPKDIAENRRFTNLTELWLEGDHYKWRQMRAWGFEEALVTGNADPYDKFVAWAKTIENLIGNPLYHWTHLELQRYFNITEPLTAASAERIWKNANEQIASPDFCVKNIFKNMNIFGVGTTDDPADTLEYHNAIKDGKAQIGSIDTKVAPSFRPDNALNALSPDFRNYIKKLETASNVKISSIIDVLKALESRLDYFVAAGCVASDHGISEMPVCAAVNDTEGRKAEKEAAERALANALAGKSVAAEDAAAYQAYLLAELVPLYYKRGVVVQLHAQAIRDNNPKAFATLGANTGFDASHDTSFALALSRLLARLNEHGMPKTIVYSLNPKDYYSLGTLIGCFQGGMKGRMQFGSAWWFCDHRDGMTEQLKTLGNLGMIATSVGMLTDSRSFLSYPRHEYYRRILCNLLGTWVEDGEYPADTEKLKEIVKAVCFENAKDYFSLNIK